MKRKFLILITLLFGLIPVYSANADDDWWKFDFETNIEGQHIEGLNHVLDRGNNALVTNGDVKETIRDNGFKILNWFIGIVAIILVFFALYIGVRMIMSMGTDQEELSKAKRSIWYIILGAIFILFPVEIYNIFFSEDITKTVFIEDKSGEYYSEIVKFLNVILGALQIFIGAIAVFMLILEGIILIFNSFKEEALKKATQRVLWIIVALIFVGVIEVWQNFLYVGTVKLGGVADWFSGLANLALYIAGPVALFFLALAGYYYIFSNGNEEMTNKGKNIIINTIIGVVIVLGIFVLLNDLAFVIK